MEVTHVKDLPHRMALTTETRINTLDQPGHVELTLPGACDPLQVQGILWSAFKDPQRYLKGTFPPQKRTDRLPRDIYALLPCFQ